MQNKYSIYLIGLRKNHGTKHALLKMIETWKTKLKHIFKWYLFFFLKDANPGNYADYSTLYAYNKNLETVIYNLRQEVSISSN